VTIAGLLSLVFILLFLGMILIFAVAGRDRPGVELRQIPAFDKMRRAIELTVEAGSRLHISIGHGGMKGPESASAFVGLSMIEKMTTSASTGDSPPVVTAGDPVLAILAQDTLKSAYRETGLIDQFEPTSSQLAGVTPFSYAAGGMEMVGDKKSSTNFLIGSFGAEVALLTDRSERSGNLTLAGTDNISAQAILYATANEPLIGEELYAGGAYVDAGLMHTASLRAQDAIRWLLVLVILVGIMLNLLGLDQTIADFLGSLL
jgi:hypothetical protein